MVVVSLLLVMGAVLALATAAFAVAHMQAREYIQIWRMYASEWRGYGKESNAVRCERIAAHLALPWHRALLNELMGTRPE